MGIRSTIPVQCSQLALSYALSPHGCIRNHDKKFQDLIRFALPQWPELSSLIPPNMALEIGFRYPKGDGGFWTPYIEFGSLQYFEEVSPELFESSKNDYNQLAKKIFRCEHSYIFEMTPWLHGKESGEVRAPPAGSAGIPDLPSLVAQSHHQLEKDMDATLKWLNELTD